MLQDIKVSRIYALALFNTSQKVKCRTEFTEQLDLVKNLWIKSYHLIKFLNCPIHNNNNRLSIIKEITKKMNIADNICNFLSILALNRRLHIFLLILDEYHKFYRAIKNEKVVVVISAEKMTDKQKNNISKNLEKNLKKNIVLNNIIDQSILDGLVIKFDSFVIDNSVSNKLNNLQLQINKKVS